MQLPQLRKPLLYHSGAQRMISVGRVQQLSTPLQRFGILRGQ
jgi:hypothetical protein